jgi:hypothetical protein
MSTRGAVDRVEREARRRERRGALVLLDRAQVSSPGLLVPPNCCGATRPLRRRRMMGFEVPLLRRCRGVGRTRRA